MIKKGQLSNEWTFGLVTPIVAKSELTASTVASSVLFSALLPSPSMFKAKSTDSLLFGCDKLLSAMRASANDSEYSFNTEKITIKS